MNAFGCLDALRPVEPRMEGDEEGVLEEYQYLVYQNVFDKKNMGERVDRGEDDLDPLQSRFVVF